MKRIVYFLATNIAIMLVLSVTMRILGVEPYLNE
ncbi:MAG: zinc metalloprotease HtpX, partial [Methylotenera sp.]|nr:zinc metalloprotease HtpX [Methylotenera sp.]